MLRKNQDKENKKQMEKNPNNQYASNCKGSIENESKIKKSKNQNQNQNQNQNKKKSIEFKIKKFEKELEIIMSSINQIKMTIDLHLRI